MGLSKPGEAKSLEKHTRTVIARYSGGARPRPPIAVIGNQFGIFVVFLLDDREKVYIQKALGILASLLCMREFLVKNLRIFNNFVSSES